MSAPLKDLEFLIGKWKGSAENQFGEKGIIDSTFDCTHDPGDKFISMTGEARSNGKLLHRALTFLMWDQSVGRYVRKSVYSYGWILNEVGELKGDRLTFDVVSTDGEPDFFKGTRWRSFLHKYSPREISTGLEIAKDGEPFRLYGEQKSRKI